MASEAVLSKLLLALILLTDVNRAQYNRRSQYNSYNNNNNNNNNNNAASATLYIFSSQTHYEIIYGDLNSLDVAGFDASKPTKIIIHGWRGNVWDQFTNTLVQAYLAAMDVNVVGVDYSRLAQAQYQAAVSGVHGLGRHVARVVDWLVTDAGVSLDSVHVMGYSLGAHIAGAVGEHVSVGQMGRITGLDSAGPGFTSSSTSGRLDASDAQFVDAIHTCAPFIGLMSAHGHADFYVNGGTNQPGCTSRDSGCSHQRSYLMFAESISGSQFVSRACDSWQNFINGWCDGNPTAIMGEHVDTSARGEFYLHTAARSPYALG